ncbi:hypothetical protein DICPUDRAFT_76499 [Dictyostelium purpureum]|uniref:Uncharacterized protein n=1 Tax=Dictyostelium purpureum TaxID=5786 RepID=F0ZDT1_DICPU|nr:uncharacterized protein DICPUDRAFT_76499 [Dictyostelium purpureum]EGC37902.1 hypothetical protein DICPUDRAFT_76499 [Dictyostelium purpureum]|eukprot:XP_003285562.1 hypothetical protein DICPUDRAFT_76499 [Dictyostelium purpureum]
MFRLINRNRRIINNVLELNKISFIKNNNNNRFFSTLTTNNIQSQEQLQPQEPLQSEEKELENKNEDLEDIDLNKRPLKEQEEAYQAFLNEDHPLLDVRDVVKLKAFKKLPFNFQMKFLTEHRFPESSISQVENTKVRLKKQHTKEIQREVSYIQSNKSKRKDITPQAELLELLTLQIQTNNYQNGLKSFFTARFRLNDDIVRLAFRIFGEIYNSQDLKQFPTYEFENLLKKVAFSKFSISEATEFLIKLGFFESLHFYNTIFSLNESYLLVYVYDIGNYLKSTPSLKNYSVHFESFIPQGSGSHAKLLNALIISHRRQEALEVFESSKSKATGEFIYYFVLGLIKMGYIEKSKLIMSEHYDSLHNDPYYILSSINVALALNQPDLASEIILNCGPMETMIPTETLQMVFLELGKMGKRNSLRKLEEFADKYLDEQEKRKLLFNSYYKYPEVQFHYLKKIEKTKYHLAINNVVSKSLKQPLAQKDQDNVSVPVVYQVVNINYEDENLFGLINNLKGKEKYQDLNNPTVYDSSGDVQRKLDMFKKKEK